MKNSDEVKADGESDNDNHGVVKGINRWQIIRDMLVFQARLALDALRDIALSPISLAAGIYDLLFNRDGQTSAFYQVLVWGRKSEQLINLFAEARHAATETVTNDQLETYSVDKVVERMEDLLKEQYERGGITSSAKNAIDRSLDALGRGFNHQASSEKKQNANLND